MLLVSIARLFPSGNQGPEPLRVRAEQDVPHHAQIFHCHTSLQGQLLSSLAADWAATLFSADRKSSTATCPCTVVMICPFVHVQQMWLTSWVAETLSASDSCSMRQMVG